MGDISSRTLHIISPGLRHSAGHDLAYTLGIAAAARQAGLGVRIHHPGDQHITTPDGETQVWSLPEDPPGAALPARLIRKAREAVRRSSYTAIFKAMDAGDIAFAHTVGYREAFLLASSAGDQRFALLQRFDHYDDATAIDSLHMTAKLARKYGIAMFTDSEDLAQDFSRLSAGLEWRTLPPPSPQQQPLPRLSRATFGFLGAGRAQKGFLQLPEIVDAIRSSIPESEFFIQAYTHPDDTHAGAVADVREQLSHIPGITLFDSVANDREYAALLDQCSVVLTPYDARTYRRVTSRVFVEGLSAGAAVMTTPDTWMAHETQRFQLERAFPVDFSKTETIGATARDALASIGKPAPRTVDWLAEHSFESLVAKLLEAFKI